MDVLKSGGVALLLVIAMADGNDAACFPEPGRGGRRRNWVRGNSRVGRCSRVVRCMRVRLGQEETLDWWEEYRGGCLVNGRLDRWNGWRCGDCELEASGIREGHPTESRNRQVDVSHVLKVERFRRIRGGFPKGTSSIEVETGRDGFLPVGNLSSCHAGRPK